VKEKEKKKRGKVEKKDKKIKQMGSYCNRQPLALRHLGIKIQQMIKKDCLPSHLLTNDMGNN